MIHSTPRRLRTSAQRGRRVTAVILGALATLLAACGDSSGPTKPPYIAIIPVITASAGTYLGDEYTYRITEISGTLHIDETRRVSPTDTVIVPVKPATYRVTLTGLPASCQVQNGSDIYLLVPEGANTAVWRFQISCEALITLTTATDGPNEDPSYIYRLTGPDGERTGIVGADDTVFIDRLTDGPYELALQHVAGHCVVTSDGGMRQRFTIAGSGGAQATFRIICSDPAKRPSILYAGTSYHDGTSGFLIRAADPNGDVERYFWDITDCEGKSVLPAGGRVRRGLMQRPPGSPDTVTILGAIEVGLPDAQMQGKCTRLRLEDEYGHTTPVLEEPIGNESGPGPLPSAFNARISTTATLTTLLQSTDPDYAGVFLAASLRDGILFTPDGQPDLGVFNSVGFPSDVLVPIVPLGNGRPQYFDYYSVIAYLFDAAGNFTRVVDNDLYN